MKKAVIVHLSDIHFDNSEGSNELINNLIIDLVQMKEKVGKYDILTITGDCVDRGKVDLFKIFEEKVNAILKVCDIKKIEC